MVLNAKVIANATCDGKPLHSLAQKVPKTLTGSKTTNKSKSSSLVDVDQLNRSQLVAIVDKLMKRQQYITPMYSILYSESYPMGGDEDDLMADVAWPASGCRFLRRAPKGWVAHWLLQRFAKDGLTKDHIAGLEKDDSSNLIFLFGAILQVPLTTGLPAATHEDGNLAAKVFYARAKAVGPIVGRMISSGFISNTGFNFSKG